MKKTISLILAMAMMLLILSACTPKKEEIKVVDIKEVHEAVKESLDEDYYPNMELTLEEIQTLTGIKEEDMESYIAERPMISANVDTFIAIKAKEGKADVVEGGLEKYRKFLVEESMQYPMNMAKVNAAEVVRYGDYIFFLMLGKFDDRLDATEEQALEFAKGQVQSVKEIIDGFFK